MVARFWPAIESDKSGIGDNGRKLLVMRFNDGRCAGRCCEYEKRIRARKAARVTS